MMKDTDCGKVCRASELAEQLNRTLSAGLNAGTLAENIYRHFFAKMMQAPSERTMVALNELNNVCSCLDDAVFAVEEAAVVVDCICDVHELSGTDDSVSDIDKPSGADSAASGIDKLSGAGSATHGIEKLSADSIFSCGLQECIGACILFLDGIKSLSVSVSECRSDGSNAICSVPISGGCGSVLSAAGCDSVRPADGCGTISMSGNCNTVVLEILKDGIKALESALASLNGIIEECVD